MNDIIASLERARKILGHYDVPRENRIVFMTEHTCKMFRDRRYRGRMIRRGKVTKWEAEMISRGARFAKKHNLPPFK